jgi:PTS system nitrogen regulatory IIA component
MRLADALRAEYVRTGVPADSREGVLRTVAGVLGEAAGLSDETRDAVYAALCERESIGSTGFGHGVAIPHCRVEGAEGFHAGLLVLADSVEFDSVDGEPVDIVPFLVGPPDRSRAHLTLLSCLAQLLRSERVRRSVRAAQTPREAYAVLTGEAPSDGAKAAAPSPGDGQTRLVHVFVQDEEIFDDVLQVFAATETFSAMVLEAHESTDYLARTPLFAGFWDAEMQSFNRIIVATVKDELVNAVVRNIEYVCGRLDEREGIMVTVGPPLRVAGKLET